MPADSYLKDVLRQFRKYRQLADQAITQVNDEQVFAVSGSTSNSIAIIMKHMAGNMKSRWTDFLTTDGEKPNRNRPSEFVRETTDTRQTINKKWEHGWQLLYDALIPLTPDDLSNVVYIRQESHTVIDAINRQLTHYAYHVGQIVLLAKHYTGDRWKSLDDLYKKYSQW